MRKIKLFELLAALKPNELKAFEKHLSHCYPKSNSYVMQLFHVAIKHYPDFPESAINREKMYRKLFLGKAYDDNKLNKLMSELNQHIEDYASMYLMADDAVEKGLKLSRFFLQRSLYKQFLTNQKALQDAFKTYPNGTRKNLFLYQFEEIQLTYDTKINERNSSVQKMYDTLLELCESEKLRWKNLASIHTQQPISDHNCSNLYYLVHLQLNELMHNEKPETFFELMNWCEEYLKGFDKEQSREILGLLKDYCIRQVNTANAAFYEQLLRVYQLSIRLSIFQEEDGYIKTAAYKNYITTCIKLGKLSEAHDFLEQFKTFIDPQYVGEVYSFNKAAILFEEGKFNEVLEIISSEIFNDVFYKLGTKRLQIKVYFELALKDHSYLDLLDNTLLAFKKYIYTTRHLADVYFQGNKNFINLTIQLLGLNANHINGKSSKLRQAILETPTVAEREWLLEKLETRHSDSIFNNKTEPQHTGG